MDMRQKVAVRTHQQAERRLEAAMATLPPLREAVLMLTAQQAADRLGVTVRQLNRYQAAGLITPTQNVPRGRRQFTESSVDNLGRDLHAGVPSEHRP